MRPFVLFVAALFSTVARAGVGVWTTNGPAGSEFGVITDFRTPGIVYTGGESRPFISTDNGTTWAATASLGGGGFAPLAAGPQTTVYATGPYSTATAALVALFASPDHGGHWNVLTSGDFGTSYLLAVDPVTPTTLYLVTNFSHGLTDFGGLGRSHDGGLTWASVGTGLAHIMNIVVAPSAPSTLYAEAIPFLFSPRGVSGLSRSLDSGTTWFLRTTSLQNVGALAIDPTNSLIVYAATTSSGVMKSVDGGSNFVPANSGLTNLSVVSLCIDPLRSNRLYAATASGVFASVDAGATWQPMNTGFTASDLTNLTGLAIDVTGGYLHASTPLGIFDYQITGLPCPAGLQTLCLNNGRFSVTAEFQTTPEGPSGPATAVPLTDDTGYFWFFDPANVEVVVKVLNGCSLDDAYWVFAAGLTNLGVQLQVMDTVTGAVKMYSNARGTAFQPIQDTSAFACP